MGDTKMEDGVDNKVITDQFRDNMSFRKEKESDFTTIVLRDMHFNHEKETNDLRNLNFNLEEGLEEVEFNEEEVINEFRNLDVKEETREINNKMVINSELETGDLIDLNFDDEKPIAKNVETRDLCKSEDSIQEEVPVELIQKEEPVELSQKEEPAERNVSETIEEKEIGELTDLNFSPPPMKHSDTRDSISSVDSDVSLSFDASRRPSDGTANLADMSDCASDAGSTKDSGCEVAEPEFIPPSDEMADRIVAQVEFYFSDVNITKDAFLLKHVKRNKEGYVSLKLISSFKRVKHLVKDWRSVAYSLSRSTKLQVNEAGTKLRRTDPLPEYDQTTPSRTVIAVNLPSDKPTIESVAELFSTYGEIALVRILRPGNPIPADVRTFVSKRPELEGAVCALVEYVRTEGARKALQLQGRDWRGFSQGIKVLELRKPAKKTSISRLADSEYSSYSSSCSDAELDPRLNFRRGSSSSSISSYSSRHGDALPWTSRHHDSGSETDRRPCYERRFSNLSNASDHAFGDRRMSNTSGCCDRRLSNALPCDRRLSNGSSACSCERRISNASNTSCCDRRLSNTSSFDRRLSNNASPFDRRLSNSSVSSSSDRRLSNSSVSSGDRRMSNSSNCDRRMSGTPLPTDRRTSSGHLPDNIVRLPLGPDGSPGFRQRLNFG